MFSRRHYRLVASLLKEAKLGHSSVEELETRFIEVFSCDNERFSSSRFKNATKV